jgi:hypothetical protein
VPLRVRRSTRSPGMEGTPSKMPAPGAALAEAAELFNYNLPQRTQIDHRVSVVFPDDGERLTFGGAKGVWRGPNTSKQVGVSVSCAASQQTRA